MRDLNLKLLELDREIADAGARIDAKMAAIKEEVARREAEFLAMENARFCRESQMFQDEAMQQHQQMVLDHMQAHQDFNFQNFMF